MRPYTNDCAHWERNEAEYHLGLILVPDITAGLEFFTFHIYRDRTSKKIIRERTGYVGPT